MNLRRHFNLVLAVLVTVGLAVTPLTVPAAAAQPYAAGKVGVSMSVDMPCCPDEQQSKDCQDCPLVAMCVLKTVQAGPSLAVAMLLRYGVRTTHSVRNDVLADGLDDPPPDHPPRNLV